MSDGRGVRNTTPLQNENKRDGSNTGRGHDASRPLRHGSGALHGIHTRLGCCFGGQTTQRCKVYECGAVLETLRADTLWEREIGHEYVGMGMCCCTLVTKLTANCVSQFLLRKWLFWRRARWVTSARTWWWPGLQCGWWRMVLVLLLANCELTSNLLSIRVVSSSSCHSSSDQAQGKIGQLSELTFEACI